jgi:hypothetical protein
MADIKYTNGQEVERIAGKWQMETRLCERKITPLLNSKYSLTWVRMYHLYVISGGVHTVEVDIFKHTFYSTLYKVTQYIVISIHKNV